MEPVDPRLIPKDLLTPKIQRIVAIVHPDQREAYQLKNQLLRSGHRNVDIFFLPESFLTMIKSGHQPDVIFVHDFWAADAGTNGIELARALRTEHGVKSLIFSTSADHAGTAATVLAMHGFSGHADSYLR